MAPKMPSNLGHGLAITVAAYLLVGVCAPSHADSASPPDLASYLERSDTASRLDEGEIVVFKDAIFTDIFGDNAVDGGRGTLVLFLVSEPPERAWDVLHDFDRNHEFMPHMTGSEFQKTEGSQHHVRYDYKVLWTKSTVYLAGDSRRGDWTLIWRMLPDHSDKRLLGLNLFWHLQEFRGRTLMAFFQNIKLSSSIGAIGQKLLVSPKSTAKAVRRRVESKVGRTHARK